LRLLVALSTLLSPPLLAAVRQVVWPWRLAGDR